MEFDSRTRFIISTVTQPLRPQANLIDPTNNRIRLYGYTGTRGYNREPNVVTTMSRVYFYSRSRRKRFFLFLICHRHARCLTGTCPFTFVSRLTAFTITSKHIIERKTGRNYLFKIIVLIIDFYHEQIQLVLKNYVTV